MQSQPTEQVKSGLYEVTAASEYEYSLIPKRKGPVRPIPGLTMYDAQWMKVGAYEAAGLTDFLDCWTFEPKARSIPFVATDPKPQRALEAFRKYAPAILDFLVPQITPHVQTYNKISAAGYPINANPSTYEETQRVAQRANIQAPEASNKFDLLLTLFKELDAHDISRYDHSFGTLGGRLQVEDPNKTRLMLFIGDDGVVYEKTVTREDKTEYIKELAGKFVGSRYRGVLNPAVINLYIQCWDTMLHRAIMKHPICYANIYTKERWPSGLKFSTFDCKHFERYMGMIVFEYANLVGGYYGQWLTKIASDPYLVKSDTGKRAFKIKPIYRAGQYPQFGSGISCVADLGKLTNAAVQVGYFVSVHKMAIQDAVQVCFSAEHAGLRRWMYGDDNRLMGNVHEMQRFTNWMGDHFDIEIDDQLVYLGTTYRSDLDRWVLPKKTYNLKLYQPERDFDWRTYPALGNVERRKTFSEYGEPEIAKHIIPLEDNLFSDVGHPYHEMVAAAMAEKHKMETLGQTLSREEATDKEYLLTPEQQIQSGMFWGLPATETRRIVLSIVSENIKQKLRI
jgi:hypothetical protein